MRPDVRVKKKKNRKRKPALSPPTIQKQSLLTTMTSRKLMKKPEVSPEALTTLRHTRAAALLLPTLILFSIKSAKEKDQIFSVKYHC